MILDVLIPAGAARDNIDPASAIVCAVEQRADARPPRTAYIEGNRYGAANLQRFRERLACAAGRLAAQTPTSAIRGLDMKNYRVAARYDTRRHAFCEILDADALCAHASEPHEAIFGERLEPGAVTAAQAARVCVGAAHVSHRGNRLVLRTLAGQFVVVDTASSACSVSDTLEEDPT